ncbi:MAG: zinc ribbon domain-containing protein [Peptoniphilus harei]|nr:zinc-ribbon domain-containing protein [Peptoniphilus harei]MDU5570046.1 zinc ribbon domain-containing protein [Peptoniphilus harei]
MYCIKCGNKLTEDMNFCDHCGSPVPKSPSVEEFKAPIIEEDPMDLVPDEFDKKPSESKDLNKKEEKIFAEEIKEEKVEIVEPPEIIEPLEEVESVEVPEIIESSKEETEFPKLEVHKDIVIPEEKSKDLEEKKEDVISKAEKKEEFKDRYFYQENRDDKNYSTSQVKQIPGKAVNVVAIISMVVIGLCSLGAIINLIQGFFYIFGGVLY